MNWMRKQQNMTRLVMRRMMMITWKYRNCGKYWARLQETDPILRCS